MDKNYFTKAGDLDSNQKAGSSFFKRPGDIQKNESTTTIENIEEYLLTIVSGKKYDAVCELGTLVGGGNIIVDINKLQEMVKLNFNIISAKYINDNMIMIEFQEFRKNNIERKGR